MPILNRSVQLAMAWCGPIFMAMFFAGLLIADFFPPIPPGHTAVEVAAQYQADANRIRTGCLLMMVGCGFLIPFFSVISAQLVRIEGRFAPICFANVACNAIGLLAITLPVLFWAAASYRPERNPELVQAMNDLGWFPFIMPFPFFSAQLILIAVAIFSDRNSPLVYPRWIGYVLLYAAVGVAPAGLIPWFTDGVFAWDGLLVFWLAVLMFGSVFISLTWGTLRAINAQYDQAVELGLPYATAVDLPPREQSAPTLTGAPR
jgi:hypothetical protein